MEPFQRSNQSILARVSQVSALRIRYVSAPSADILTSKKAIEKSKNAADNIYI